MLHAIIMAGGTGTRFWPASRNDRPKQLLQLVADQSMIRQTVSRLEGLVPVKQRHIITNHRLVQPIYDDLGDLLVSDVIGEPCKRDTAPCIGLAAMLVGRQDPDAIMVVMPADHVIRPVEQFQAAVRQAAALVDQSPHRIVTFGIKPSYPAEVFGYIHRGQPLVPSNTAAPAYTVKQFKEKPDAATAKKYLDSGEYYWNSGIFVWKAATILGALLQRQPDMHKHLEATVAAWGTAETADVFDREFAAIKPISIDYAVMEQADDVVVIEAPFTWDDLGGWQALARLAGSDEQGNTLIGRHVVIGTSGSIVRTSDDHLVVMLGMEDTIVVHTPNATLVANKHDEEQIRRVVKLLEERGWSEYL
jgi:mannose-1-phosphate guanylyltransferase